MNYEEAKAALITADKAKDATIAALTAERDDLRAAVEQARQAMKLVSDERDALRADVEQARRTAQYWKDNHLAGNDEIERLRADAELWQGIAPLLASAWFYGGWRAETKNERDMQEIMERAGWWPIRSDAELMAKIDATRGEKGTT